MTSEHKDTIYIDVEDDITAVIDKVRHAKHDVVALVLPKRPAALQSVVNLRLLKRASTNAKKNIVLITNDPSILPLAGSVGLHVAKTLQTKPYVPKVSEVPKEPIDVNSEELPEEEKPDQGKPIGELALEETIEVDNTTPPAEHHKPKKEKHKEKSLAKKLKVPNFEKFRLRLLLIAGGVFLLLILWIFMGIVLPKAKITVTTDTSNITTDLNITGKSDLAEPNFESSEIPAFIIESKKVDTGKVQTTGTRDDGTKAKGTMTLTNCIDDGKSYTIPAGTGFSSGDLTFVTDSAVTLDKAFYSAGVCESANLGKSKKVGATAISGGEKYNVGAKSYNPPAAYSTSKGSIQASGSAMTGGTTKITKIVSQKDVDAARQAALDKLDPLTKTELSDQFKTEQATGLEGTFKAAKTEIKSEPEVDKEASEATVTVTITYTQFGVKNEFLNKFIEETAKKQIDTSKQSIQDSGLDSAKITVSNQTDKEVRFNLLADTVIGPSLDADTLKKEIAGTKKGKTKEIIISRPGIQDVDIRYSPFWVRSTPKKVNRIDIIFKSGND